MYCSILEFSGGIAKGNLDGDYSDVYTKATLNGQPVDSANLSFMCRAWIDGGSDSIVMRWVNLPATGSIFHIPAGATFKNGGTDTNLYLIEKDIYLQLNGNTWTMVEKPSGGPEMAEFISPWANADMYNSNDRVLLQYKSTNAWASTDKGDLVSKVTYKNSETGATRAATDADIAGWDGQKWIVFFNLAGYDVLEIAAGGTFGGVGVPAVTLYNVNGRWITTAPTATATVNLVAVGVFGWNNLESNGTYNTILQFSANLDGATGAGVDNNYAASLNLTSLMVKFNGKTFFELYKENAAFKLSYAHGNAYFFFSIPTDYLVASNGYEVPTLTIDAGTPFMSQNLPATTLVLENGLWQLKESAPVVPSTNFNPSFVSINAVFNNDANGFFIVQFNTDGWEQAAVPTNWSGITYNGQEVTQFATIQFYLEHSVWFAYNKTSEKLTAGYNGYSHPTIKFAEGATVVYNEKTYTFQEMEFYLVNDKWTTEKPADWTDKMPKSVEFAFIAWNNIDYGFNVEGSDAPIRYCDQLGLSGGNLILLNYGR